jgi:hypothetical protein
MTAGTCLLRDCVAFPLFPLFGSGHNKVGHKEVDMAPFKSSTFDAQAHYVSGVPKQLERVVG